MKRTTRIRELEIRGLKMIMEDVKESWCENYIRSHGRKVMTTEGQNWANQSKSCFSQVKVWSDCSTCLAMQSSKGKPLVSLFSFLNLWMQIFALPIGLWASKTHSQLPWTLAHGLSTHLDNFYLLDWHGDVAVVNSTIASCSTQRQYDHIDSFVTLQILPSWTCRPHSLDQLFTPFG